MSTEKMIEAMRATGGEDVARAVDSAFDFMAIAADEIEKAQARWPRAKKSLSDAFLILMPGDLRRTGEALYRSHCRELLWRVWKGEDVRPGTAAECCLAMMESSLRAPLTGGFAAAYGAVFTQAFPEQADIARGVGHEAYSGETREIIEQLRKKIGSAVNRSPKRAA